QRPFNFETAPIDRRDDAYRFMNGTPHVPALYACRPGIGIVKQAGVEKVRAKSIRQTARIIEGALAGGWRVNSPTSAAERGGTVSVDCPHAPQVTRELLARDILVDFRPQAGIRLSPHFYNGDEEIDFALEQIAEILATRAWERHMQTA
ncbi:MAG TPA: kynureninase, partial [Terriglobia bacterium]|nr:kynureninase [Terriglobia bacterium]